MGIILVSQADSSTNGHFFPFLSVRSTRVDCCYCKMNETCHGAKTILVQVKSILPDFISAKVASSTVEPPFNGLLYNYVKVLGSSVKQAIFFGLAEVTVKR